MGVLGRKIAFFAFLLIGGSALAQQTSIVVNAGLNGQTTNTCNGFIIDSGGQGGSGYSNGEDVTFTVCPDNPSDIINVQFNLFNLDPTDGNPAPNISDADKMMVFDGNSTAGNFLGEYTTNGLQGVLVQCTPQNTSGCLTFRFISNNVGNSGFFSASASCTTPCDDPFAGGIVLNGITNDSIQGCLNQVFSFEDVDSYAQPGFTIAEYKWDFMDGSTAIGQNVTHAYSQPGHYRVQLFITDNNGCTNNNLVDIDVLVATKPNFVDFQSDTTLCIGENLQLTATPQLYENTWEGFTGETTINNGCMTDDQLGVAQNVDIIQTGFSSGTTITDISQVQSLCLDMEHSFMGDLVVSISCPNGQSVLLHQQGGGGTQLGEPNPQDNVDCTDPDTQGVPYSYCFTSGASQTWVDWANANGGTLPVGDYLPVQSLGGLVGCPANGVWTLTVVDNWAADDGTVFSFELILDPSMYPPVVEFTPEHGVNLDSSYWSFPAMFASNLSSDGDAMTLTPNQAGTFIYEYTVVNSFGCANDTSFTLTVTDFTLPITLDDQTVCAGNFVNVIDAPEYNCSYTLRLEDSFGDGWNGNNLLLNLNGTNTSYTIPSGGDIANFQIPVQFGDELILTFDGVGSFDSECSYQVLNCDGVVIYNGTSPLSNIPYSLFVSPFTIPVSYNWTPVSLFETQNNVPNPELFLTNSIAVSVSIFPTGHPLCAENASFNINVLPNSYVGQDSTISLCEQSQPISLFPFLGFGANPNGTWTDPADNPITMPVDPVTMLEGSYRYTVDLNSCVGSATITVNKFSPEITNVTSIDATCTNAANGSITVTAANYTSYKVNNGPNLFGISPFTINNLVEGNYTITVVGAPGCSVSEDVFINDPDSLEITFITPPTMICLGDSVMLTANGSGGSSNYIYNWSLNGVSVSSQQNITVKPSNNFNSYCLTLSEECGSINVTSCTDVLIEPNLLPLISTSKPNVCINEEVVFNDVTTGNVFSTLLTFGDGDSTLLMSTGQTINHLYDEIGPYSLTMTTISTNGCIYNNNFSNFVEVHQNPTANFYVNPDVVLSNSPLVSFINQSSPDVVNSLWYIPGVKDDTIITYDAGASYPVGVALEYPVTLTVTNAYGCVDSITKIVIVQDDVLMYIPNSFTPNGDEFNNVWNIVISGIDLYNYTLTVYNRWGQVIFVSNDPSIGWDGTYGNTLVQAGIYQWRIEGVNQVTGDEFSRFGFLNVFR